MKRRNGLVKRLTGHILLIEADGRGVIIDCMLRADDEVPVLVTLSFSVEHEALDRVLGVLRGWDSRDDTVEVMISDGRRGAQVEMRSGNGKLVLTRGD